MSLPFDFEPTEELLGGWCAKVYADETRVLKVPYRGEELTHGYHASLRIADHGGPRILAHDPVTASVLMERIRPGTSLSRSTLAESQRNDVFIDMVRRLRDVPTDGLPSLDTYVDTSMPLARDLLASTGDRVFLHGDLHHENIIEGPRGEWVVIDPKGIVGDPAFEAAAWLRNPIDALGNSSTMTALLDDRLAVFEATFGWDRRRMMGWAWLSLSESERPPGHPWSQLASLLAERLTMSRDRSDR
jgi:streptomycin 6-kinase